MYACTYKQRLLYEHIEEVNVDVCVQNCTLRERERERERDLWIQLINTETPYTPDYFSNHQLNIPFAKMPLYYLIWPVWEPKVEAPCKLVEAATCFTYELSCK